MIGKKSKEKDMRLRNITGADTYIENSEYVIQEFKGQKGNWKEIFKNGDTCVLYI